MNKIRSTLYRFRLLSTVLALAVLLSALAVTPTRADAICDDICSGWNNVVGCTTCNHCCVYDDGHYVCTPKYDRNCGTGGL